jgi:hypothetical protein
VQVKKVLLTSINLNCKIGGIKMKEISIHNIQGIPVVFQQDIELFDKPTGYKALVDEKTKETVSIVTDKYQPIQHRAVWIEAEKQKNYMIKTAQLYNKGKSFMIELKERTPHKVELLPGDYLERGVRLFNSYNCTKALTVESYGLRLVCMNGMVAPMGIQRYHKAHVYNNIDINELGKYIELAMEAWVSSKEVFKKATQISMNVDKAIEKIGYLPKKYAKIITENLSKKETLYDIWNEVTRTITHDMAPNVSTNILVYAQKQANKVLTMD